MSAITTWFARASNVLTKAAFVNLLPPQLVDDTLPVEKSRDLFARFVDQVEIENHNFCNRICWFCPNSFIDRRTNLRLMQDGVFEKIISALSEIDYDGNLTWSRYHEALADERVHVVGHPVPDVLRSERVEVFGQPLAVVDVIERGEDRVLQHLLLILGLIAREHRLHLRIALEEDLVEALGDHRLLLDGDLDTLTKQRGVHDPSIAKPAGARLSGEHPRSRRGFSDPLAERARTVSRRGGT